jgi:short-subunit dehydrogenase
MGNKKVVLVVGASSGIGESVSRRLARSGVTVYAVARRTKRLEGLKKFKVHTTYMDVTDLTSIKSVVNKIIHEQGRIDCVINNAGYGEYGIIEEVDIEKAKHQFEVNLFGLARVNQVVLPYMRRQGSGRIIIVASSASHVSTLGSGWYGASKHAVNGLTEALRMEVQSFGIDVIQIEPGPVKTEFEHVAIQSLNHQNSIEDYKELLQDYQVFLEKMYKNAPSTFSTVNDIVKACLTKKTKKVYRTTISARLLPIVRYIMGIELYSKCVHYVIRYRGKNNRKKRSRI